MILKDKVILEKDNKQTVSNNEMVEVSELVSTIQDTQDQIDEIEEKLKAKEEIIKASESLAVSNIVGAKNSLKFLKSFDQTKNLG